MKKRLRLLAIALLCAPLASLAHDAQGHTKTGPANKVQKEWGIAADAKAVTRTVEIAMTDSMRFSPDRIHIKQGEVVKFVIKNSGKMLHEMVLGTKEQLDAHAAMMAKFPNMDHDEPYMTHVKPGATSEIIWNFNRAGNFDFACLIAGHYQAGMVGKISVAAAGKGRS